LANLGKLADLLRNNNAGQMRDARFTPDGSKIVTARSDARLSISRNPLSKPFPGLFPPKAQPFLPGRIWDAESGAELAAVEGDRVAFIGVAFSPDDQRALFRGDEYPRKGGSSGAWWFRSTWSSHGGPHIAQALLWDIGSKEVIHIMDAGRSRLWVADFNPKNGDILTATDEALRFWSPEGVNDRVVPGATGCHWTAFSLDGSSVLSQDDEGYAALWDVESMNRRCRIDGAGKKPSVAWLMADGTAVGTLTETGRLAFWNTPTGSLIWASEGSGANTGPVVMSANGRWLAAVVTEQRVDLWDLKARKLVRTIERHVYEVTALAFSRDSEWLATGDASGESWLWPLRLALP
jgi:WD40 repeat protein